MSYSADEEHLKLLWNPKVLHLDQNILPVWLILSYLNPVHSCIN